MRTEMSGSPSGPGTVRSSLVTFGLSGTSMPASIASTVARRCTMSGMALKPPGSASRSWSRGTRASGSIRSRRDIGDFPSDGEGEALVTFGCHFIALLAVLADAARVRHEHPRLARHVRTHVPGVRLGVEGVARDQ